VVLAVFNTLAKALSFYAFALIFLFAGKGGFIGYKGTLAWWRGLLAAACSCDISYTVRVTSYMICVTGSVTDGDTLGTRAAMRL